MQQPPAIRFIGFVLLFLLVTLLPTPSLQAADHVAPPAGKATDYATVDVHDKEHVAIAADPCTSRDKCPFFRIDYNAAGFLPVRLIVTNDGDAPISLAEARIYFIPASGERVQTSEVEDIERRIDRAGTHKAKIPLPAPLPPVTDKGKNKDKDINADFQSFEYQALVVPPHATESGYLFYDVSDLDRPLQDGKMYLRMLKNSAGKELFYFEIPFDKGVASSTP